MQNSVQTALMQKHIFILHNCYIYTVHLFMFLGIYSCCLFIQFYKARDIFLNFPWWNLFCLALQLVNREGKLRVGLLSVDGGTCFDYEVLFPIWVWDCHSLAGPLITTHQSASRPPSSSMPGLGEWEAREVQNNVDIDMTGSVLSLQSHSLWWQWLTSCLVRSSEE